MHHVLCTAYLYLHVSSMCYRGGYYVVKVRDNLKVISLQTNYCNNEN